MCLTLTAALSTAVLTWVEMWYTSECEASLFILTASVSHPCVHLPPPFSAHHVLCMCPLPSWTCRTKKHIEPLSLPLSCLLLGFKAYLGTWPVTAVSIGDGSKVSCPWELRAASNPVTAASIPVGSVILSEGKAGWKLSGSWPSAERQLCYS